MTDTTAPTPDPRRQVVNRLRRAQGQLGALITAVEDGGSCRDVVTQLAAVSRALDRAGFLIVASAMKNCVSDPDGVSEVDGVTSEELEKLFLTLA